MPWHSYVHSSISSWSYCFSEQVSRSFGFTETSASEVWTLFVRVVALVFSFVWTVCRKRSQACGSILKLNPRLVIEPPRLVMEPLQLLFTSLLKALQGSESSQDRLRSFGWERMWNRTRITLKIRGLCKDPVEFMIAVRCKDGEKTASGLLHVLHVCTLVIGMHSGIERNANTYSFKVYTI